jgi:hypothetical protein
MKNAPTVVTKEEEFEKRHTAKSLLHILAIWNDFHGPLKDKRISQTGGEIDAYNIANGQIFVNDIPGGLRGKMKRFARDIIERDIIN